MTRRRGAPRIWPRRVGDRECAAHGPIRWANRWVAKFLLVRRPVALVFLSSPSHHDPTYARPPHRTRAARERAQQRRHCKCVWRKRDRSYGQLCHPPPVRPHGRDQHQCVLFRLSGSFPTVLTATRSSRLGVAQCHHLRTVNVRISIACRSKSRMTDLFSSHVTA